MYYYFMVEQLERRRGELNNSISEVEFENLLHSIKEISEKVSIPSGMQRNPKM